MPVRTNSGPTSPACHSDNTEVLIKYHTAQHIKPQETHLRLSYERACNCNALLLPPTQHHALLPAGCVVAIWECCDEVVGIGLTSRLLDLLLL